MPDKPASGSPAWPCRTHPGWQGFGQSTRLNVKLRTAIQGCLLRVRNGHRSTSCLLCPQKRTSETTLRYVCRMQAVGYLPCWLFSSRLLPGLWRITAANRTLWHHVNGPNRSRRCRQRITSLDYFTTDLAQRSHRVRITDFTTTKGRWRLSKLKKDPSNSTKNARDVVLQRQRAYPSPRLSP
jgi:hypothetical protein